MNSNYYDILNVNKNSSQDEIKKSYRKLSMINHPDKPGGDVHKFQEINAAYQVLSDNDKRRAYDHKIKYGITDDEINVDEFADISNLFGNLFKDIMKNPGNLNDLGNMGNMSFFAMGPGIQPGMMPPNIFPPGMIPPGMMPPGMMPQGMNDNPKNIPKQFDPSTLFEDIITPEPVVVEHVISLQEAYTGIKNDDINFDRWVIINTRRVSENKTIHIDIPPGVNDNEIITIEKQGNFIDKNNIGDIEVVVKIHNDTQFKRVGNDLIYNKNLTFKESLCGFTFTLHHISGRSFALNNNNDDSCSLIYNGFQRIIPKFGFKKDDQIGNLIINFTVTHPQSLTSDQIKAIREII